MRKHILTALLLLLPLLLTACAADKGPTTATISLPTKPGSACTWSYSLSSDGVIREIYSGFDEASAHHKWTFAATAQGETDITFIYAHPDTPNTPEETATCSFSVDETGILTYHGASGTMLENL